MPKTPGSDEGFDRQIGIGLGLGMTQAALAEHLGVSENTIGNHLRRNKAEIEQIRHETKALYARQVAFEPVDSAEAKNQIRDESWQLLYRLVKRTDLKPSEQIALLREGLDRTEGKSVNRMLMFKKVEHEHVVQIPAHIFDALGVVLKEQKLLPEAIDIEQIPK